MQLKRNTKEFKLVRDVFEDVAEDRQKKKKLLLYVTKAGDPLKKKIKLDSKLKNSEIIYEFQLEAIKYAFLDKSFQLFRADGTDGLYYFKTKNDPDWDQHPFQFKGSTADKLKSFWEAE